MISYIDSLKFVRMKNKE